MKWTLVVIFMSAGQPTTGITIPDFERHKLCVQAGDEIVAMSFRHKHSVNYKCVKTRDGGVK